MHPTQHTDQPLIPATRFAAGAALLAFLAAPVAMADITYKLQFDPTSSPEALQIANSVAVAAFAPDEARSWLESLEPCPAQDDALKEIGITSAALSAAAAE